MPYKELARKLESGSCKHRKELRDKLVEAHRQLPGSTLKYIKSDEYHICYHELVLFTAKGEEIGRLSSTNPMGNILNNFLEIAGRHY